MSLPSSNTKPGHCFCETYKISSVETLLRLRHAVCIVTCYLHEIRRSVEHFQINAGSRIIVCADASHRVEMLSVPGGWTIGRGATPTSVNTSVGRKAIGLSSTECVVFEDVSCERHIAAMLQPERVVFPIKR